MIIFIMKLWNSVFFYLLTYYNCLGHSGPGEVQNYHDCLLPWCYGLHPHVRYHERGLLHRSDGLEHPNPDLLVGQHPSHPGRQQVRHGGRAGGQDFQGQGASRPTKRRVLRIQCKGFTLFSHTLS